MSNWTFKDPAFHKNIEDIEKCAMCKEITDAYWFQ